jgi:hypothetical protein
MPKTLDPARSTFDGDVSTSRARLRQLTEETCRRLPAYKINMLAFVMAVHVDSHLKQHPIRSERVSKAYKREQLAMKRARKAATPRREKPQLTVGSRGRK